jgi:hypothetical protein
MKLKLAIVAMLLGAFGALAQDAGKTAKIEEMLRLTKADRMMQQAMSQARTMTLKQVEQNLSPEEKAKAEEMHDKLFDAISARLSWEKLKPSFIQIYSEVYTDEELDGILAFYRSPAGRAMIEKMPQLMSRTMTFVQKLTTDLQPDIEKMVKEPGPQQPESH